MPETLQEVWDFILDDEELQRAVDRNWLKISLRFSATMHQTKDFELFPVERGLRVLLSLKEAAVTPQQLLECISKISELHALASRLRFDWSKKP